MKPEDELAVQTKIDELRALGGRENHKAADRLEQMLVDAKAVGRRVVDVTIDSLREWLGKLKSDVIDAGKEIEAVDSWHGSHKKELREILMVAWSAAGFRARETAEMLEVKKATVEKWLGSKFWVDGLPESERALRLNVLADLATSELARILALKSDDEDIVKAKVNLIKLVVSGGINNKAPNENVVDGRTTEPAQLTGGGPVVRMSSKDQK